MARIHRFERQSDLPLPRETVFAFFADASNLARITPPAFGFENLGPGPIPVALGARIDHRLGLLGIRFRWRSRIIRWEPPRLFVDEQESGPFASWVHTHSFEDRGSSTRMSDDVRYRLPFAPFGELAAPFVRAQLRRVFAFRESALRAALVERPGTGAEAAGRSEDDGRPS